MPYDVDGYVPSDMTTDDNYCRHGTYVGGCGYDHLCFWCEMGEEPPTRHEIDTREIERAQQSYDDYVRIISDVLEPLWGRARTVAWLGGQTFNHLPHRDGFPIRGAAWSAWNRLNG